MSDGITDYYMRKEEEEAKERGRVVRQAIQDQKDWQLGGMADEIKDNLKVLEEQSMFSQGHFALDLLKGNLKTLGIL